MSLKSMEVINKINFNIIPVGFKWDNIPHFSIITGKNGTGKTHLLNILSKIFQNTPNIKKNFYNTCNNIFEDEIYFNTSQRFDVSQGVGVNDYPDPPTSTAIFPPGSYSDEQTELRFKKNTRATIETNRDTIKKSLEFQKDISILKQAIEKDRIFDINKVKTYFDIIKTHTEVMSMLNKRYPQNPKDIDKFTFFISDSRFINDPNITLLNDLARRLGKSNIKDLNDNDIESLKYDDFQKNSTENAVYELCIKHEILCKSEQDDLLKTDPTPLDKPYNQYKAEILKIIIRKYGKNPYLIINEILNNNNFEYILMEPTPNRQGLFFEHRTDKTISNIPYRQLSSGEKTVVALVSLLYKKEDGFSKIKLMLLDEPDAHLHPSLAKQFLKILNDIVSKLQIQVIMTTHSPATVAIAEESNIFIMKKDENNIPTIEKGTKEEAFSALCDNLIGFTKEQAEFDIEFKLQNTNEDIILCVEGKTDPMILSTAFKKLYPNKEQNFCILNCFNNIILAELFKNMSVSIFKEYLNKKFIALFDNDSAGFNEWDKLPKTWIKSTDINVEEKIFDTKKNNSAILLPVPSYRNNIKNQHLIIELLFTDDEIQRNDLEKYFSNQTISSYKVVSKMEYAKFIQKNPDKFTFEAFRPLFEKIDPSLKNN